LSNEPYADTELAALYDLFYADYADDLAMYESFARRGEPPALELGTGTGRVALHLARAELAVVALDGAPPMLDRLRSLSPGAGVSERIQATEGDMRAFELNQRFDLILCAANTFQHLLTTEDQLSALRCIGAHLTPGGAFVAKLESPGAVEWDAGEATLRLAATRTDPDTGETVMRFAARSATASAMRTRTTQLYDRIAHDGRVRRRVIEYELKYTPPDELALLMSHAGLRLMHMYGDYDLSPYADDSDSMIVVAGLEG
jgi:SAM-dependent methyltransferase